MKIGGREFGSRLMLGTGKFASTELMAAALEASGTRIVTVALRRVDFRSDVEEDLREDLLSVIDTERIQLMPNTSGAMDAQEAVRIARLGRSMGCGNWVKLEIHPNPRHLLPDPVETLRAAEQLVAEDFVVLPYINADPVLAKRLEEAGCATVMPLGAPIGSNRGIRTRDNLEIIIEEATVPVVVDAGIGQPSHAAEAMEMGADAVLVNTAIAISSDPARMGRAFRQAVEAGRAAWELGAGLTGEAVERPGGGAKKWARPSSPLTGFLREPE